ncbi:MAG: 6-phosphofructokinase [Candidatus Omnitrophota bacterium]
MATKSIKRIGVLTSGGDAPGMNAAIRSIVRYAIHNKLEVIGISRGYAGLINEELEPLTHRSVSNIINRGGTILKTARSKEFKTPEGQKRAVEVIKKNNIDALIIIGGNGTHRGAYELFKKWKVPVVGVGSTIDNDLNGIDYTLGYDTAVNTALEAIDKIRDTATSMERIFVVEVMGRDSGLIALQVALAAGAEEVLIPEVKFDFEKICHDIVEGNLRGKISWIIIVAEGAASGQEIGKKIEELTDLETKVVVLGHVQRGGTPSARDRILAARLGTAAVDLVLKNEFGKTVGLKGEELNILDIETAMKKKELDLENLYKLVRVLT